MKIIEENNETVVHFGRVLSEKEKTLLEICLVFFQSDNHTNSKMDIDPSANDSHMKTTNGKKD